MRRIAIINQKGGVGKTATAVNVSHILSEKFKALLIDLDPQSAATYSLGVSPTAGHKNIYNLLKGQGTLKDAIVKKGRLDVLTSSLELSGAETELATIPGREFLLKEIMDPLKDYQYVFIDCPPSLGILTVNAMVAVNELLIPVQADTLSLQGLSKLLETIGIVKERINPDLKILGVVVTSFDSRKILSKQVVEKLKAHFGKKLFKTKIRTNVSIAECPGEGKPITEYAPKSHGSEDYKSLSKEIIRRGNR